MSTSVSHSVSSTTVPTRNSASTTTAAVANARKSPRVQISASATTAKNSRVRTTSASTAANNSSSPRVRVPKNDGYSNCSHSDKISCPACTDSRLNEISISGNNNNRNAGRSNSSNSRLNNLKNKNQICSLINSIKDSNVANPYDVPDSSQDSSIDPIQVPSHPVSSINNSSIVNQLANEFIISPIPIAAYDLNSSSNDRVPSSFVPSSNPPLSIASSSINSSTHTDFPISHSMPSKDNKLLDLNFEDYHQLLWIVPTLEFIPEACLLKVRQCHIKAMQKIKSDVNNVENWKKFILLPIVLLSINNSKKDKVSSTIRKDIINKRAALVLEDDWDSFTFGYFPLKTIPSSPPTQAQQEANKYQRAEKLARNQEFGRAMSTLSSTTGVCRPSVDTVESLRQLHPERCEYTIDPNKLNDMKNVNLSSSAREVYKLNGHTMRKIVRKKHSLVKPAGDGRRFDHESALMGTGKPEAPTETEYADLFTDIIVLLMDVKEVPKEVYVFLRLNTLVALEKSDKGVRPVGMGCMLRKTCCGIFLSYTFQGHPFFQGESFNKMHFGNLQYGVDSKGTEKINHFFEIFSEINPESDLFFVDGCNAFNSVSRLAGLEESHKWFPQMTPFLMQIYYEDSYGCYFGLKEGVQKIKSQEGFHQGCPLASWLYCMAYHPFIKGLADILSVNEVQTESALKVFIDDTNLAAKFPIMRESIRHMITEGSKIGFKFNSKKGAYLLAACPSDLEAIYKKNCLIDEFGLHPDIIRIHPTNLQHSDIGQSLYGAKVLGVFLGADAYIQSQLSKKITEMERIKNVLIKVDDKQILYLLLVWCYCNKITYWQRNMAPRKIEQMVEKFQQNKREILETIAGSKIDDARFQLALLPLAESGLGLGDSALISHSAFIASSFECFHESPIQEQQMITQLDHNESVCYNDILTSIHKLAEFDDSYTVEKVERLLEDGKTQLQHHLSKVFIRRTRADVMDQFLGKAKVLLNSFRNDDSGLCLSIAPKTFMHTFSNRQMQSTINFRLFMKQENIPPTPYQCPCTPRRRFSMDPEGFHCATGCTLGGFRTAMHNDIVRQVQTICRYAGLQTTLEPPGIFQGNELNLGDNCKGDLAIYNLGPRSLLTDVRITSVVPPNGRNLSPTEIRNPTLVDSNLQTNYAYKMGKYGEAAKAVGFEFLPLVADIGGKLHPDFKKFLTSVLKLASESRNIPFSILWKYWISALMITLQRGRATSIIKLTSKIFGRQTRESFETSDQVVSRCVYMN